ncbi:hypothetical protein DFR33_107159 [Bradymonas sediminis]|nr:hypothetical protein DFR33_107159 [Bradymonas sediminis]
MRLRDNLIARKMLLAAMASGLMFAASCGGDEGPNDTDGVQQEATTNTYALADTQYTRNIRVYNNVKRLDDRAAAVAVLEEKRVLFPLEAEQLVAQYKVGDIMATAAGEGLIRRVESVERTGDSIVVTTSGAELSDVFAEGEIFIAKHAEANLPVPESFRTDENGMSTRAFDFGGMIGGLLEDPVGWDGSLYDWNRDFASDLNSRIPGDYLIVEEASVDFDLGGEIYAQLEMSSSPLKSVRIGSNGTATATLRVRLESADEYHLDETYTLFSTNPADGALMTKPIKSFDVAGLAQIQFGAKSTLKVKADLDGTLSATGEVKANGTLSGGVEKKGRRWKGYWGHGMSVQGYGPDFQGEKNFVAQLKLNTELTVNLSNTVSGDLKVEPANITADFSQKINATTGACPTYFNINAAGKASGAVTSANLMGFKIPLMSSPSNWNFYDKDWLIRNEQLNLPGICDPEYVVPSFGTGAGHEGQMCAEDDDCKTGTSCYRNTCVHDGPTRFSVAWFDDTDIDLEVVSPAGEVVDWENFAGNASDDGLVYDFPNCTTKCVGNGPYVESIFSDAPVPPGVYTIRVVHHKSRIDAGKGGDFEVEIESNGVITTEGGNIHDAVANPPFKGKAVEFEYTVK